MRQRMMERSPAPVMLSAAPADVRAVLDVVMVGLPPVLVAQGMAGGGLMTVMVMMAAVRGEGGLGVMGSVSGVEAGAHLPRAVPLVAVPAPVMELNVRDGPVVPGRPLACIRLNSKDPTRFVTHTANERNERKGKGSPPYRRWRTWSPRSSGTEGPSGWPHPPAG